nr:hypothetical protein [Ciceribacter thiooxidans]
MFEFSSLGLSINLAIFAGAAVAVWMAGVRITGYASAISEKTGAGQAFIGVVLLGGITSLPEVAVGVTSSISGDASLAVNSILGGIAMQVAILAFADMLIGRRALTSVIPDPVVMLQGGFKILLLSIVAAAVVVGDIPFLFSGLWMWLLASVTVLALWVLSRTKRDRPWVANDKDVTPRRKRKGQGGRLKPTARGRCVRSASRPPPVALSSLSPAICFPVPATPLQTQRASAKASSGRCSWRSRLRCRK